MTSLGMVDLHINPNDQNRKNQWIHDPFISMQVLNRLFQWVYPKDVDYGHSLLSQTRNRIINYSPKLSTMMGVSGIALCPPKSDQFAWTISRQPFAAKERPFGTPLSINSSVLWDNRFYISCSSAFKSQDNLVVRPFLLEDFKYLNNLLKIKKLFPERKRLWHTWKSLPVPIRETLPCVATWNSETKQSKVLAVPILTTQICDPSLNFKFTFLSQETEHQLANLNLLSI